MDGAMRIGDCVKLESGAVGIIGAPLAVVKDEENIFRVGEVVYLKSGGPPMTVEAFVAPVVAVAWFAGDILRRDAFLPDQIHR